ncbi:MAG: alpha/beta hydrolase [Isosphaeraceae bacterium]|jgi:pimeloyl-ACP methyl ester carboxylesterase
MTGHFVELGGIRIHYLDHPGGEPALVLLPGLSATAPIFEDLIGAGLAPRFRAVAVDLRGRGQSDGPPAGFDPASPAAGYTMAEHAADVVRLLDALGLRRAVLVGHSFGGMLAFYLAAHHPQRIPRIVVLDAAFAVAAPATRDLLRPMLARLGVEVPSWDAYLEAVRQLPYLQDRWEPGLERYFRSYVRIGPDGKVRQLVQPEAILAALEGILVEDWEKIIAAIRQPVLLINAMDPFGPAGSEPFLPREQAMATVEALEYGSYLAVAGNHITMIFGNNARAVAAAIGPFASTAAASER